MSAIIGLPYPPSSDTQCSVCFESPVASDWKQRTWAIHTGKEGHKHPMHKDCYFKLFQNNRFSCPNCNESINPNRAIRTPYIIQACLINAGTQIIETHAKVHILIPIAVGLFLGLLPAVYFTSVDSRLVLNSGLALGASLGALAGGLVGLWNLRRDFRTYYFYNSIPLSMEIDLRDMNLKDGISIPRGCPEIN